LPYPFASDLWAASSWQAQYLQGPDAKYGLKTVGEYIHRPKFEFYDMQNDPQEGHNLADSSEHTELLQEYVRRLQSLQDELEDPWIIKWKYE
jgi:N-sulfoglucosamine sulfohydrolase